MEMCFKKVFPVFILLLLVIVMPQAFAQGIDNATDFDSCTVGDDVITADVENSEILASNVDSSRLSTQEAIYVSTDGNDKNNGSESAPYATIYRAVNVAADSGINNIYILEGTYKENSIPIETSVNIMGIGNVVIDAENVDRIFKIDGEYEVELSNMTLMNGVAPLDSVSEDIHEIVYYAAGGAIDIITAYVKMNYMTFINNVADDFGGAVNVEAQNCVITNSVFKSNYAGVFGGAIDFEDNNCSIENCTFILNEAGNGGAVGCIASACTIADSYFENNTAETGAAIFIENGDLTYDDSNSHLIKNNTFIHNYATQQGGAIEVENQQMSENADWTLIDGNEFIDNYGYNGGAISAYYGDAGITNNIFINNTAGYGGAIAAISTTDSSFIIIGGLYLKNNTIIGCTAEENGNAIYNMGYYGTAVNITFNEGKTVYSNDGKAVILNVTVCDDMGNPISGSPIDFTVDGKATINPATDLYEGKGSVRFVPRQNGTFIVSGIFKNKFDTTRINLVTSNLTVDNAIADYFGTIYISDLLGDDDNTGAEDSPVKTFNQGYVLATRAGGSFNIVVNEGRYFIPGYTIEKAINITGIGNPILDGKNQATLFALYGGVDDEFHITGLTFVNGIASPSKYAGMNEGGAIFFKGGKLFLEDDTFIGNSANDYGGAVHINKGMDSWGTMYKAYAFVNNCTFKNNVVKYFGGAISLYDSDVIVKNSYFESNQAKNGGAISILNGMGNLTVINSSFYKNNASDRGGALDVEALNTYNVKYFAEVVNSTFESNCAEYGGAIVGGDNTISNCVFIQNTAKVWGGAVLFNDTISTIDNSIFENNKAEAGSSYYGYSNLLNYNFWGFNFKTSDEIKDKNIAVIKNDTESRSWVNPVVVNDTNMPSWVNIAILGPNRVLPGNYEFEVKFVSNNGDNLENIMPDYSVKISKSNPKNLMNVKSEVLTNNVASLNYNALIPSSDKISVLRNGIVINSVDINVYVKKDTLISLENKSYLIFDSKSVTAVLSDLDDNPLSNKTLNVYIGDENYTLITNDEGIVEITLNLTSAGKYDVFVEFIGDDDYLNSSSTSDIEVVKESTTLNVASKSFIVTSTNNQLTVTLKDMENNPLANKTVTFNVKGKYYNRTTNAKGQATLKLPSLAVNTYKINVAFRGNENYLGVSGVCTVKINKEASKMSAPKKTYKKSNKNKKLTVTLKSASGKALSKKKVTFKVNGKTYSAKTNSKGQATVKVKLTAKKTYKFTVKFAGDSKFKAVTKTSSVKIK